MNDLPRRPVEPLAAPHGAFDRVTRRARTRRARTAVAAAGFSLTVVATGVFAALPSPGDRAQDHFVTTPPTGDPTVTPTPSASPSPSPSPVEADRAAGLAFIDAWRRGDAAGMRRVAAADQPVDVVEVALESGTPDGQPDCTRQRNGQYQCVVTVSTGKVMYVLVGQPGAETGLVWWVGQVAH